MYQTLEIRLLIIILGGLGGLVLLGFLWYAPPDSLVAWLRQLSYAASGTATIVGLIGNKWVFGWIWRRRPIQSLLFPYIAGEWVGTISSNWPVVKSMMDAFIEGSESHPAAQMDIASVGIEEKPIKVTIEADLFRIAINLETADDYSSSQTIVVRPQKSARLGRPRLLYIYQNDTSVPKNTDSASHFGAACLEVFEGGERLEGCYWTARNWTKGLNTAGRISLRRPPQPTGRARKAR